MKKIFTIGLALIVSLTMATGAFAETKTNDVDITIESGEFSLATSDIESFGTVELLSTPETYKTSFENKFTVKDLRGTQSGWRVDVSASQFSDGTNALPKGTLSLEPVSNIERVGTGEGELPVGSMDSNLIIDDGVVTVITAEEGSGMGVFDFEFPENALSVVIDPTTAKVLNGSDATYTSTLTWNLVQAP